MEKRHEKKDMKRKTDEKKDRWAPKKGGDNKIYLRFRSSMPMIRSSPYFAFA